MEGINVDNKKLGVRLRGEGGCIGVGSVFCL